MNEELHLVGLHRASGLVIFREQRWRNQAVQPLHVADCSEDLCPLANQYGWERKIMEHLDENGCSVQVGQPIIATVD